MTYIAQRPNLLEFLHCIFVQPLRFVCLRQEFTLRPTKILFGLFSRRLKPLQRTGKGLRGLTIRNRYTLWAECFRMRDRVCNLLLDPGVLFFPRLPETSSFGHFGNGGVLLLQVVFARALQFLYSLLRFLQLELEVLHSCRSSVHLLLVDFIFLVQLGLAGFHIHEYLSNAFKLVFGLLELFFKDLNGRRIRGSLAQLIFKAVHFCASTLEGELKRFLLAFMIPLAAFARVDLILQTTGCMLKLTYFLLNCFKTRLFLPDSSVSKRP
jgi:hypothetical protein